MLRLRDFLSRRGDPLQLEALTGDLGLDRQMPERQTQLPGGRPDLRPVVLTGHRTASRNRVQVGREQLGLLQPVPGLLRQLQVR